MTYRERAVRPAQELTESEAFALAQSGVGFALGPAAEVYRWGWVYHPDASRGPIAPGPGPVSVTRRGEVISHGSVPYPFSDDEEPVDRFAPRPRTASRFGALLRRLLRR